MTTNVRTKTLRPSKMLAANSRQSVTGSTRLRSRIEPPVIAKKVGRCGVIQLNAPRTNNALSEPMCEIMITALTAWKNDNGVDFILIDQAKQRKGFCHGADLLPYAEASRSCINAALSFFRSLFRLIHMVATYPKPCIAIMNGPAMGCGVGLGVLASHPIVTDKSTLSIHEPGTSISAAAGSTWFLPRLEGKLGTWLALTGARLNVEEILAAKMAYHYCPSEKVDQLKRELYCHGVSILGQYRVQPNNCAITHIEEIDQVFASSCLKSVLKSLQSGSDWAKVQAERMKSKSPMATGVALRQVQTGEYLQSIGDALRIEYRLILRLVETRDFREGIRAKLIEKDHCPSWSPDRVKDVNFDMVARFFAPSRDGELAL